MKKKGVARRKWSKEEKLRIVNRYLMEHTSILTLEKEEGASNGLICAWLKRYQESGEEGLVSHNGNPYAALHKSKSLSEVERLRLLVAKQEVEIERLKKGYWVEGDGASKVYVTGSGATTKSSKCSK